MKKVIRAVSLLLLMAGMTGNAFAEGNENIIRQGAIRGRVLDMENKFCRVLPSLLKI